MSCSNLDDCSELLLSGMSTSPLAIYLFSQQVFCWVVLYVRVYVRACVRVGMSVSVRVYVHMRLKYHHDKLMVIKAQ